MLKFIYISVISLSFFSGASAQEKKYVYYDSSMMNPQQEYDTVVPQENTVSTDHADELIDETNKKTDTLLYANELTVSPDSVESWKNAKAFAYARYLDSLLRARQERMKTEAPVPISSGPSWLDRVFASPATKIFFWTLAVLFVLFILYKLFLTEGVFRKKVKTTLSASPEVTEEVITNDSDLDAMIKQAIRSGNYRLAVRYQYLRVLHKLADKKLIELAADKTNYQYVREMSSRPGIPGDPQFKNDFASLTLSYEYVWYGEFVIDELVYRKIESGFNNFNQKI